MVYEIKVGAIKPDKLEAWNEKSNPYDVLDDWKNINQIDWVAFLRAARSLFTDEVQLDWGSYAYKATKEQLKQLTEEYKAKIEGFDELPDENLGVVFIEMS